MKTLTKKIVIPENPGKLEDYHYTFTCPHCNNETTVIIDEFRNINNVISKYDRDPIDGNRSAIQNYTIIGDLADSMKCGCCCRHILWPKNVIDDFREIAKQFDACEVYTTIFYAVCYIIKHSQQSIKGFKLTDLQWIDKCKLQSTNNDIYFTIEWKQDTPDIMMHCASYDKLSSDEIEEVVQHIKSITFDDTVHADMIGLKFQFLSTYSPNTVILRNRLNPYMYAIDQAISLLPNSNTNVRAAMLNSDRENRNKCSYDQRDVDKVNQALQTTPHQWVNPIKRAFPADTCYGDNEEVDNGSPVNAD